LPSISIVTSSDIARFIGSDPFASLPDQAVERHRPAHRYGAVRRAHNANPPQTIKPQDDRRHQW
jgi:hypothetical protein